jgi:hypothetical protein
LLPTLCLFSSLLGNGVELIKFDAIFFFFSLFRFWNTCPYHSNRFTLFFLNYSFIIL